MRSNQLDTSKKAALQAGVVIPAHPLALTVARSFDQRRQQRLTQYYLAAGAGGIAVGVHTTQFQIRDPQHDLLEPVLAASSQVVAEASLDKDIIMIAGVSGNTATAVEEAQLARKYGYDIALLSTNGLADLSEDHLIERAAAVAEIMPIMGFYLQPAVGGRILSVDFWCQLSGIENLVAIKIAPFDRYQTLEVVRGVCGSARGPDIALYTGNDDNIVADLLTTYRIRTDQGVVNKEIVGGLLGHWAVWTHRAVQLLDQIKKLKASGSGQIDLGLLTLAQEVTDANAAFFDAKNNFAGCIAGIHEVLRRQGLLEGIWCLDPEEKLSPGQQAEINRVYSQYPELNDDSFVTQFLASHKL